MSRTTRSRRGSAISISRRADILLPRRTAKLAAIIHTDQGRCSIHAGTCTAADDRPALERLLRYAARPAFSHRRLSRTPSGKVCYRLAKPYYTGQTEVVLEPVAFLRRLAALVPPRGQHQVRYYGALAPQSRHRVQLAGLGLPIRDAARTDPPVDATGTEKPPRSAYRQSWAQLLARVFKLQVLICPRCQGPRTIIAAITALHTAARLLSHLDLPTDLPTLAHARAPPQLELNELM